MTRIVSASNAQKHFGETIESALHEAIIVTRHGREVVAMLSAEEYRRLHRLDRVALAATEIDELDAAAIEAAAYGS